MEDCETEGAYLDDAPLVATPRPYDAERERLQRLVMERGELIERLQELHEARCDRVAAAHDVIARNAERRREKQQ